LARGTGKEGRKRKANPEENWREEVGRDNAGHDSKSGIDAGGLWSSPLPSKVEEKGIKGRKGGEKSEPPTAHLALPQKGPKGRHPEPGEGGG